MVLEKIWGKLKRKKNQKYGYLVVPDKKIVYLYFDT